MKIESLKAVFTFFGETLEKAPLDTQVKMYRALADLLGKSEVSEAAADIASRLSDISARQFEFRIALFEACDWFEPEGKNGSEDIPNAR